MASPERAKKGRLAASEVARRNALSKILAERWWAVALRGVVALAFGLFSLSIYLGKAKDIVIMASLLGTYLLIDGVLTIISAFRTVPSERWRPLNFQGVISLIASACVFLGVRYTQTTGLLGLLTLTVITWGLVSGALMLGASRILNLDYGRSWLALAGVASLVLALHWALLVYLGIIGGAEIPQDATAEAERAAAEGGLPAFIRPLVAYWIAVGVFLVGLALQLQARHDEQMRALD
jgi:uncharacterized membrane protein HdeD (DUF308 family)